MVSRRRPSVKRYNAWAESFLNLDEVRDYDVYLWGSFPEKRNTKDVDVLMYSDKPINTAEIEELMLINFDESLVKNNFLVDLGFTDERPVSFDWAKNYYEQTGQSPRNSGYVYGNEWTVDDRTVKRRMDWVSGTIEELSNNVLKIQGKIPYNKMQKSIEDGTYDQYYKGKPKLIKEKGKRYS